VLGRSPRGPFPAIAGSLALLLAACPARADDAPAAPEVPTSPDVSTTAATATAGPPELTGVTFESVALTATGFLTAFVVHEACHAAANLAFGNVPTLEPVRFLGFVPFFAVSPGIQCAGGACTKRSGAPFYPGPRGYQVIVGAGIVCQEVTDEIILTARPRIRTERAPFLKGMLLFNTAASVAYGIANLAGIEPPEGDVRGYDSVARVPHGVLAATVLATAALDVARYFLPDEAWLPWVSRGTKVVTIGLLVAF
jgi:hypothetical protein